MYAIIIGCGRVGAVLATLLSAEGNNIVVIDSDEGKLRMLGPEFTGEAIAGDGTDLAVLENAKIQEADALVAATGDDNSNLMSAQIAKKIYNVERVLVRIKDPNKLDVYREYDLETVSATTLAAYKLAEMLKTTRDIEIIAGIGNDRAKIVKFQLPTPQTCDALLKMVKAGAFSPAVVCANGKLSIGLPEKLVPGTTIVGSILTEDMKQLNRLFPRKKG